MLRLSYCRPGKHFRVHELLFQQDSSSLYLSSPSLNEAPGSADIDQGEDGYWDVLSNKMYTVRAGPILHTIPCLGYVIQEADSPERIPQSTVDAVKANAEALKAQGEKVPMKLLSRLKEERQPITLPDGTILQPPAMTRKGVSNFCAVIEPSLCFLTEKDYHSRRYLRRNKDDTTRYGF